MSDPVTNFEIEDVLSSIRRLVSEGDKLRPDARRVAPHEPDAGWHKKLARGDSELSDGAMQASLQTAKPALEPTAVVKAEPTAEVIRPEQPTAAEEINRFVLTPAHRIDAPIDTPIAANDGPLVLTSLLTVAQEVPGPSTAASSVVAGAETAETEQADPEVAIEDAIDDAAAADASEMLVLEADVSVDGAPDPLIEPSVPARKPTLEETIAELEAAVTHHTDDWEPDGSEGTPVVDWKTSAAQAGIFASRGRKPVLVEDAIEVLPEVEDETTASDSLGSGGTRTIAVDIVGAIGDDLAAENPSSQRAKGQAGDPTDDLLSQAAPEQKTPQADARSAGTFEADSAERSGVDAAAIFGDDTVIDEAALRDLVAEIVREELQGKLGERITRNVRKLVRREIYRVISSESFD